MLSRTLWLGLAGIALVTGIVLQDGKRLFSWTDPQDVGATTEHRIKAGVERAVEVGVDKVPIVVIDARKTDVPPETRRALNDAVGKLVKAEAELALLSVREAGGEARQAAEARRDQAKAEVDTLMAQIERQKDVTDVERVAIREEVRNEIRDAVRDAVGG